ncbi:MAG: NAD(P)H-dependent oxidoreductase subunit E [Acidimicrobiia bacterium]|nr:NAD(P)H-dependent oxidoreductase subunit E [Acidimicrobiia bacterium]MYC57700.1 NAD(P)H-dependent oxidoreductase subunit E [Acidimicrobiia bacterium]MYI30899.1 NAD(P)H-dependent oxidoreductase subunit E [Acidimicrobiia bacterium]
MARLTPGNITLAQEIITRYPVARSALIPLLHLAQEQDGYVSSDAMVHIAELLAITPAEVMGTCSFYEMFKREPVGEYMVNICHGISCHLLGASELIHHAVQTLGIKLGDTTEDGKITLEAVECIAACTEAPCLQVNYRYRDKVSTTDFDQLIDRLRTGTASIAPHGKLARTRQHIASQRRGGVSSPEGQTEPAWLARNSVADTDINSTDVSSTADRDNDASDNSVEHNISSSSL